MKAGQKMGQQTDKRRFKRSRDYGPRKISVSFENGDGSTESCEATLWDFSEGGLGMDSPRTFETGDLLDLEAELYGPAFSMGLKARARVAYCRRVDTKKYRVGVAFLEASYRRLEDES